MEITDTYVAIHKWLGLAEDVTYLGKYVCRGLIQQFMKYTPSLPFLTHHTSLRS